MNTKQIAATCVAVSIALVAILSAFTEIGLPIPKFASQRHVADAVGAVSTTHVRDYIMLAGEVKTLKQRSLEQAISSNEIRAGNLRLLAEDREAQGKSARSVRDQIRRIESESEDFNTQRKALIRQ